MTDDTNNRWYAPVASGTTVYPYNSVTRTRAGHIFEVDDTLGNERIYRKHKSGTSEEINATGEHTLTIFANGYKVVLGDDSIAVSGNVTVNIGTPGKGNKYSVVVNGNYDLTVNGDYTETITGVKRSKVKTDISEVTEEYAKNIGGDEKITVHGSRKHLINGSSDLQIDQVSTSRIYGGKFLNVWNGNNSTIIGNNDNITTGESTIVSAGTTLKSTGLTKIVSTTLNCTSSSGTTINSASFTSKSKGATTLDSSGAVQIKGSTINLDN
jgi:hypothetical protein